MNKRMLTLALALATSMIALPVMAQDNFPDVPENHWAYEALENLKREGILVGYPDGTYKGPRAATRYEMAIALNAAYTRLKSITDGLAEQIAEIRRGMSGGDNSGLADRLTAVENQLRGMGSLRDDVAAMKRMADEFQKELASLGVDVESMKKDMDEMKKMMSEGKGGASIKISGDANIVIHAGQSDRSARETPPDGFLIRNGGVYGIDGRILGFDENANRTSIFGDMNVYHEIAMNIAGTTGVKWDATLVYGNLVGDEVGSEVEGYGNQSGLFQGLGFDEGRAQMYVQRFVIDLSDSLPFKAHVGRLGAQSDNPYLFRRSDNTPYFENSRWDDGNWIMDGALLSFDFGKSSNLVIAGGRNNNRMTDDNNELNPVSPGSIGIGGGSSDDQQLVENTFMAQAKVGLGDKGSISGTYLFHSLVNTVAGGDRLEILGGQLKYNFSDDVKLTAGYGQTNLKFRSSDVAPFDEDNTAWFGSLDFKVAGLNLNAGYREIQENYIAPGDWERIGTFYSPRGVQDFQIGGTFNLGQNLKLAARGIFGEFIDSNDYNSLKADLHFGFGGGWDAMAGFEQFTIENAGTDARQRWLTFGLRRDLAGGGLFKLVYQYGDHNVGFGNVLARGVSSETVRSRGHILFSQVSVKF